MKPIHKVSAVVALLIIVFSGSFLVFYVRAKRKLPKQPLILTPAVINQPLPKSNLVDMAGKTFADEKLRQGKVMLVFMMPDCSPCDEENSFLQTVINKRKDVRFIYVMPFGNKEELFKAAQDKKYTLSPFYDEGMMLSRKLQMLQVPIKVFVEDGIIKRTWIDATLTQEKQAEFVAWLNKV
jgi:AhpC/TSA family